MLQLVHSTVYNLSLNQDILSTRIQLKHFRYYKVKTILHQSKYLYGNLKFVYFFK